MLHKVEERLWNALLGRKPLKAEISTLVAEGSCTEQDAFRILEKWNRKGWYNYGSQLDLGWPTGNGSPV